MNTLNTLKNRLIIALVLATPSYTFLWLIRGYDLWDMTLYAHATYSAVVFVILVGLFEIQEFFAKKLKPIYPWKSRAKQRFIVEFLLTLLSTPIIVTSGMALLYVVFWDMKLWWPSVLEYNLFALAVTVGVVGFVNLDEILEEWRDSLLRSEKLEKENMRVRLGVLQNQLSPHFMFNNFSVLRSLIDQDGEKAKFFIDRMSVIYRYILENESSELVPLKQELDFIRNYVELLNVRFDNNLILEVNDVSCSDAHLPPLSIQILIENAVKHNEISSRKPLHVEISVTSDEIVVQNKLQPKNSSIISTAVGLPNLSERIKLYSGKELSVHISDESFLVRIPLLQIQEIE